MHAPHRLFASLTLLGTALACRSTSTAPAPARDPGPESAAEEAGAHERPSVLVEGEPMITVLEQDAIPSIDAPRFVSAAEASAWLRDEETVLGVVGPDGTAKAYSTWQLDGHEIVNDRIDGVAIAATW